MSTKPSDEVRRHYWREQIDAWQSSGQSQQSFCQAHDLSYSRFGYWVRKFRQHAPTCEQAGGFVPVMASPPVEALTLRLPSGVEIHGISRHNLALVEQLISRLS